jgi:molybdenum cofactor guanylyltransferase
MGHAKALLPFGPELMLQRVVRLVGEVVRPVVVVAAQGQILPELPAHVTRSHDLRPDRGPLEGMAAGLRTLAGVAPVAFVTACDVPLLRPPLIHRVLELLGNHDAAVPHVAGRDHPLLGAYRVGILRHVEDLLDADQLRLGHLLDRIDTRRIVAEELADVDPLLESLTNLNGPADYQRALQRIRSPFAPEEG